MIRHNCVQYSPAWWRVRRGVPTASQFDRVITPKGWKPSKGAATYISELVAETADLRPNWFTERPMSPAQRHGLDTEPEARRFYATMGRDLHPEQVQMVGFCHTADGRFGCSPDGLVLDAPGGKVVGGLELKCVQLATQAKYLIAGTLPPEYKPQVHGQLLICGFEWVDFLSYAPGLDPLLIRVYPDEDTLKLREALESFDVLYNATLQKLGVPRHYPTAADARDEAEPPAEYEPSRNSCESDPWEEPIGPIAEGSR